MKRALTAIAFTLVIAGPMVLLTLSALMAKNNVVASCGLLVEGAACHLEPVSEALLYISLAATAVYALALILAMWRQPSFWAVTWVAAIAWVISVNLALYSAIELGTVF